MRSIACRYGSSPGSAANQLSTVLSARVASSGSPKAAVAAALDASPRARSFKAAAVASVAS